MSATYLWGRRTPCVGCGAGWHPARRLATGAGRINNPPDPEGTPANLPRMAASCNEWWRFSAVMAGASKRGRRIDNPPQVNNLPHNSSCWRIVVQVLPDAECE